MTEHDLLLQRRANLQVRGLQCCLRRTRHAGDAVDGAGMEPTEGGIGEIIRRYRQRAGLSQEEFAERADLSVRAVRNLELSKVRRPRRSTLHRIGLALDLDDAVTARLTAIARTPEPMWIGWIRPPLARMASGTDASRVSNTNPAAATEASGVTSAWAQLRPLIDQLIDQSDPKRLLVVRVLAACPICAVNANNSADDDRL